MSSQTDEELAFDFDLKDLKELKEELAEKGTIICPVQRCEKDFKSLWGLKYHMKRGNHEDVGRFKCDQCVNSFHTRVALRQHTILCHAGSENESPLPSPGLSRPR